MSSVNKTTERNNCYRPSASVIIAARTEKASSSVYDYEVLLFKRTPKTAYAANHCVFPGGMCETSDESVEWLDYLRSFGISNSDLQKLVIERANPPPIFSAQGTGCYDRFFKKSQIWARDITLRITAVRETFEEVGVLLCCSRESLRSNAKSGSIKQDFDRVHWQNLVHNDAREFLNLCKHLDVVPDLWSLYEWSVWRAPATATRRYETVFYIVALEELPELVTERSEVDEEVWGSPYEILELYRKQHIWLPFIQYYELARLAGIHAWQKLLEFAFDRQRQGSTLFMPVYYRCEDAMVGLLPGDDQYPSDPSAFDKTVPMECTSSEFRSKAKNIHRLVYPDGYRLFIDVNIAPLDGHLRPINFEKIFSKM